MFGSGCNITLGTGGPPRKGQGQTGEPEDRRHRGDAGDTGCYNLGLYVHLKKTCNMCYEKSMQNGKPYSQYFNSPLEEAASFALCTLNKSWNMLRIMN